MRALTSTLCVLALVCGIGCGSGSSRDAPPPASTTAPATTQQPALAFQTIELGATTGVVGSPSTAFASRVVTDDAALLALWNEHQAQQPAPSAAPTVDFSQERLIAVFLGERPTDGFEIEIVGVAEVGSGSQTSYVASYVERSPVGPAATQVTRPFHIALINRAQGAITFQDVTPPPVSTPVADVHGELFLLPTRAGGTTLGFLADGASEAYEITDPSALLATGVHDGHTLVLDGDVQPNVGGLTAALESLRVATFANDDFVATPRLRAGVPGTPQTALELGNKLYVPIGPLAQQILTAPFDRPLRVTGRVDPTIVTQTGVGLIVTSWRPATELSWNYTTPLLGFDRVDVDDVSETGAYRASSMMIRGGGPGTVAGDGRRLDPADVTNLQTLLAAADLRNQPSTFQPAMIYPDHPVTTLRLGDAAGDVSITIWAGATLPAALDALVQAMRALPAKVPTFRNVERGDTSQIVLPSTEVARDQSQWLTLWGRHVGTRPLPPTVDFTSEVAVGVFDGQRPTGGFSIEVSRLERIGTSLHLSVTRTSPSGPAPSVLTAPYDFVAVKATAGDLYVDGVRTP